MLLLALLSFIFGSMRYTPGPSNPDICKVYTLSHLCVVPSIGEGCVYFEDGSIWSTSGDDLTTISSWEHGDKLMLSLGNQLPRNKVYHLTNLKEQKTITVWPTTTYPPSSTPGSIINYPLDNYNTEEQEENLTIVGIFRITKIYSYIKLSDGNLFQIKVNPPTPYKNLSSRWKRSQRITKTQVNNSIYYVKLYNQTLEESLLCRSVSPFIPLGYGDL